MSYFEIKTIKGHDYLYLRQSIRIGKRVVHKHIAYLGRVDGGRVTGSSGSSQTINQAKREYQEPKKEPVKPKVEVKPKKKKIKLPTIKAGIGKGQAPGKEKIERSQEEREKLLRKKKKKLKKFLRKKKLKEIKRDNQGRFIPAIP